MTGIGLFTAGNAVGATNGTTRNYVNGSATANGSVNKTTINGVAAGNGAVNRTANGSATGIAITGVGDGRSKGVSIGKVNGSMSTDVVIPNLNVAKRVLQPPAHIPEFDEQALRILPSDEGFSWAKDNYSATQRQIDVWSFVLTLRARVWLLDAKWTYVGGFNEEKQVSAGFFSIAYC